MYTSSATLAAWGFAGRGGRLMQHLHTRVQFSVTTTFATLQRRRLLPVKLVPIANRVLKAAVEHLSLWASTRACAIAPF